MGLTVAQCIHGLGLGGAQKVIASIVRGRSPEIEHIVYSCEDGVLADEVRAAGAEIRIIPRRIPKWDHGWMLRTAKAFTADGVDVVHGHLFGDTLHGYFASRRASNLPFLMTLHNDYESFSRVQKIGYSYLLKRAACSVGCSDFVQRTFAEHCSVNGRLTSIVNGVEVPESPTTDSRALLSELGVEPGRPVLMAFGRLSEQKGFSVLVRALAALKHKDAHLVLVGEGDLEESLRSSARELGVEDRLTLAGFRDDVGDLMYAADIVVFSVALGGPAHCPYRGNGQRSVPGHKFAARDFGGGATREGGARCAPRRRSGAGRSTRQDLGRCAASGVAECWGAGPIS